MKNLITGVVLSVAAHGAVLYPIALKADEECGSHVRAAATQEFRAARQAFVRMATIGARRQVATLTEVSCALTAEEKEILISGAEARDLPDALAAKIDRMEGEHFTVLCLSSEEAMDGDAGWKCVGDADTYDDAPYPLILQELIFEDGAVYACTEYVTRDAATPSVDAYSCSVLDLEDGEIYGRRPLTSIDPDEVSTRAFAYVNDVPLHETMEHYIAARITEECAL